MRTDTLFYKLFATYQSLLFELIERPYSAGYRFTSAEIKEKAFRFDGIFRSEDIDQPIMFMEVQFQPKPDFYWEFVAEIFLYLNQYRPIQDWQAVAIFAKRSVEPELSTHFRELIDSERIIRVYLEDWIDRETDSIGIAIVQLILAPQTKAPQLARALVTRATPEVVEFIETVLVYKFPKLSRKEIEAMFTLDDLKQTRFYQEAFEEGEEKGEERGRVRTLQRQLNRKFGQISFELEEQINGLSVAQLDDLAEAILDFDSVHDLESWLKS